MLKMRTSTHVDTLRTYEIADGVGIRPLGAAPLARGLLTGVAHDFDGADSGGAGGRGTPVTTAEIPVVDDERPLRELLASLLEDAGYQARAAIHGRDAPARSSRT